MEEEGRLLMTAQYGRMTMIGGDFSVPVGKFVVREEIAEYFNALQTVSEIDAKP